MLKVMQIPPTESPSTTVREEVRRRYSASALGESACADSCCTSTNATDLGYSPKIRRQYPKQPIGTRLRKPAGDRVTKKWRCRFGSWFGGRLRLFGRQSVYRLLFHAMTLAEFFSEFETTASLPPGSVHGQERLDSFERWDSFAVVEFMSMADEKMGVNWSRRK